MSLLFTNNATGTLASTLLVGGTSAVLSSGEGALFPTPSGGDTFTATLEDTSGNIEIVSCTARSGDTLTIARAQEGTSAQEFAAGTRLELRMTAGVLDALLQSVNAATTYAPLTHYSVNGLASEVLYDSEVVLQTTNQGALAQRASGQTSTVLGFKNSGGTTEGVVQSNSSGYLEMYNQQTNGNVQLTATDGTATPVFAFVGDPNGSAVSYYSGDQKILTTTNGALIYGENAGAPYNSFVSLFNSTGGTQLASIGYIGTVNELRIQSVVNSFPVGVYANNALGTLTQLFTGDPDGAFSAFFANAKKIETTADGVSISGTATQSTAPTDSAHLTTKAYVDTEVGNVTAQGALLNPNGYYIHPNGFTEQWGQVSVGADGAVVVNFSQPFSSIYTVVATVDSTSVNRTNNVTQVSGLSTSSFTLYNGDSVTRTFYWNAKGAI